jgi:hypothetical protein
VLKATSIVIANNKAIAILHYFSEIANYLNKKIPKMQQLANQIGIERSGYLLYSFFTVL